MSSEQSSNFLETTDLEALARRARALETLGLFDAALAEWRQILRIDPNYLPAWEGSARVLKRLRGEVRREREAP